MKLLIVVMLFIANIAYTQKVTLRWEKISEAKSYQLQVASAKTFDENDRTVNRNVSDQKYDITAEPGVYYYRLRTIDKADRPGLWSSANKFEILLSPPKVFGPPNNRLLKARGKKNRSIKFSWKKFDGAKYYVLKFDKKEIKVTGTSHKMNAIVNGVHNWKIKTVTNKNENSSYSKSRKLVVNEKAAPTAPVLIEPIKQVVINLADVGFKWEGVDGATKYNVYIKLISENEDKEDKRFKFVVSKLKHTYNLPNGKYEWMVISRDKLGRGGYSEPGYFTVQLPEE